MGGDEFIVLLDCGLPAAQAQIERLTKWVCGGYTVEANNGPAKLTVNASIGLAEHVAPETMKQLLDRADLEMYRQKPAKHAVDGMR
jgi:GGDEF domain-containing protein